MTDTPSSILLTREQSTGSNTNLWGGYLITTQRTTERAVRGYQALTVTGDTTVAWTNYSAANDYGAAYTKLNGSPTASWTHTLPGYQTFQGAWNNTGQSGTLKNSGGTGITVPTGRRTLFYGDATDIFEASPNWLSNAVTSFVNAGDIVTYNPMVTYVTAAINAASTSLSGAFDQKFLYTAVGGETSVSGSDDNGNTLAYTPGYCDVYLNGSKLVTLSDGGSDYVATTGTSITGLTALTAGDVVEVKAPKTYAVANTYTQAQTNALFGAPPVGIGSTTPTTGAFTTLSASGEATFTNAVILKNGSTQYARIENTSENVTLHSGSGNSRTTAYHLNPGSGTLPTGTIAEYVLHATYDQAFGGNYRRWSFSNLGTLGLGVGGTANVTGIFGEYGGTETPTAFTLNLAYEDPVSTFTNYEYWHTGYSGDDLGCTIFGADLTNTNTGTSGQKDVIQLSIPPIGSAGQRDSHYFRIDGKSNDGSAHVAKWRQFVNVTSNAGASTFTLSHQLDGGAQTNYLTITDAGAAGVTSLTASGAVSAANVEVTGSAGTNGMFLQAAGTPTITAAGQQVMRFLSSGTVANYMVLQSRASGVAPQFYATSDSGLAFGLGTTGSVKFNQAMASSPLTMFEIASTASATAWAIVSPGASADPNITASANNLSLGAGSAVATNATAGLIRIPTCAGTPTGAVADGCMVIDTTNHKLYFRSGGTWRDAGP